MASMRVEEVLPVQNQIASAAYLVCLNASDTTAIIDALLENYLNRCFQFNVLKLCKHESVKSTESVSQVSG